MNILIETGLLLVFMIICITAAVICMHEKYYDPASAAAAYTGAAICTVAVMALLFTIRGGIHSGSTWDDMKTMPLSEYAETMRTMPDMDNAEAEKDSGPCLMVWLRFSCDDCHRIIQELMKDLEPVSIPVYYCSTRDFHGVQIVPEGIAIDHVPMLVYKDENGRFFYCDPCLQKGLTVSYDRNAVLSFLEKMG